jgi:hypothetical protein
MTLEESFREVAKEMNMLADAVKNGDTFVDDISSAEQADEILDKIYLAHEAMNTVIHQLTLSILERVKQISKGKS